jgi:hypothetical protein
MGDENLAFATLSLRNLLKLYQTVNSQEFKVSKNSQLMLQMMALLWELMQLNKYIAQICQQAELR